MPSEREILRRRFGTAGILIGGLFGVLIAVWFCMSKLEFAAPISSVGSGTVVGALFWGTVVGASVWLNGWAIGQVFCPPDEDIEIPDVFD